MKDPSGGVSGSSLRVGQLEAAFEAAAAEWRWKDVICAIDLYGGTVPNINCTFVKTSPGASRPAAVGAAAASANANQIIRVPAAAWREPGDLDAALHGFRELFRTYLEGCAKYYGTIELQLVDGRVKWWTVSLRFRPDEHDGLERVLFPL